MYRWIRTQHFKTIIFCFICVHKSWKYVLYSPGGGGGGTSIWGVHGGVPRVRVTFSRKNSEKGMSIFHKDSRKGYNICKKFHIGSVILMTQMTNQKKTELIDFFDLVWTKIHNFWKIFWKSKPFFPKAALKMILWRPPLGTKIPKRVQLFPQKFQKGSIWRFYSGTPPSENIMSSPPGCIHIKQ